MAIHKRIENECVSCPQGCINCGRREVIYTEFECDECHEIDSCMDLYENSSGRQLCVDCALEEAGYVKVEE